MVSDKFYIVKFNWKRGQFHIEPRSRLRENASVSSSSELLDKDVPSNLDLALVGIAENCQEVQRYIEAFQAVRFHLRVDSTGDDCWPWQGCRLPAGYGRCGHRYAHRVAWELAYGPIPEGKHVLHKCDNPPCCRPDHLFLGTMTDNIRDRDMKGRGRAGLTPHDVRSIRARCAAGESSKTIARAHSIAEQTVRNICSRKTWDWLETDHTIRGAWGL